MNQPSRFEVEEFAKERFHSGIEIRIKTDAEEKAEALARVRSTHNIGGYLPALIEWKQECLRRSILAMADALVEAGNLYEIPLERWAEQELQVAALQMAGGANSALLGELDLLSKRTRRHIGSPTGNEISRVMNSALREGLLRLETQNVQMKRALRAANPTPLSPPTGLLIPSGDKQSAHNSKRAKSTVESLIAARRMDQWIEAKGFGQTEFANRIGITGRTLLSFRKTGKLRRDSFQKIAELMGTTAEELLKPS
jgi:hypothetical protein